MHLTLLFLLYSDSTVAGLKHLTASEEKEERKKVFAGFYLHDSRGGLPGDKCGSFASRMGRTGEISSWIRNSMKRCWKLLGNCPCLNGEQDCVSWVDQRWLYKYLKHLICTVCWKLSRWGEKIARPAWRNTEMHRYGIKTSHLFAGL